MPDDSLRMSLKATKQFGTTSARQECSSLSSPQPQPPPLFGEVFKKMKYNELGRLGRNQEYLLYTHLSGDVVVDQTTFH